MTGFKVIAEDQETQIADNPMFLIIRKHSLYLIICCAQNIILPLKSHYHATI